MWTTVDPHTPCQTEGDGGIWGLESRNDEGNFLPYFLLLVTFSIFASHFKTNAFKFPMINFEARTFGGEGTCDAWYKNSEGYNWTLWPADCITYWSVLIFFFWYSHPWPMWLLQQQCSVETIICNFTLGLQWLWQHWATSGNICPIIMGTLGNIGQIIMATHRIPPVSCCATHYSKAIVSH